MSAGSRLTEDQIAQRAAMEIRDGEVVNVGAGMPFLVSQYVPPGIFAMFHIEHGILGVGKVAGGEQIDPDLLGLGRRPLIPVPGASCFSSAEAFAMLRGGHVDLSVLGAYQVSEEGDLANWIVPGQPSGVGGAMDIVKNVKRLFITMTHTTKKGEPKIVKRCSLPLTGARVVHKIFTDIAVIEVTPKGLVLEEVAPGFTPEEVQAATEPRLIISPELKEISLQS
ncbi:MAG TPA: 3-oxoacid CoA-transferase subunit B [bacterium]|nr:3-oxoacid CoA-transferase subunit B [bacterium]